MLKLDLYADSTQLEQVIAVLAALHALWLRRGACPFKLMRPPQLAMVVAAVQACAWRRGTND